MFRFLSLLSCRGSSPNFAAVGVPPPPDGLFDKVASSTAHSEYAVRLPMLLEAIKKLVVTLSRYVGVEPPNSVAAVVLGQLGIGSTTPSKRQVTARTPN